MSAHLNFLEKISSITGELAVYKENGILAVVRIEKITIEPDMISFKLKPLPGRRIGLESLKVFTASSSFEFLNHSDGRYTCSIVSWELETDPVKVIYLKNLINGIGTVDQVLSTMRKRQVLYDDETTKVLSGLMRLKRQINNRKILLASETEFKGQSWGALVSWSFPTTSAPKSSILNLMAKLWCLSMLHRSAIYSVGFGVLPRPRPSTTTFQKRNSGITLRMQPIQSYRKTAKHDLMKFVKRSSRRLSNL